MDDLISLHVFHTREGRNKKKSFEVIEKIEGYTKLNGKLYIRRENVFFFIQYRNLLKNKKKSCLPTWF